MPAAIVDGKVIAKKIEDALRVRVEQMVSQGKKPPLLAVFLIGDHKPSETYVRRKEEAAERVGIGFQLERFPATVSEDEIIEKIRELQGDRGGVLDRTGRSDTSYRSDKKERGDQRDIQVGVSGIIVQMPLPNHLDAQRVLSHLEVEYDVDVLTMGHFGALALGREQWLPPTPGAIMEILKYHAVPLAGKHVVLVGRGDLVGKPLALLLMREPVTVTVCGRSSQPLEKYTQDADIVITAVGRANTITGSMLKPGAVVIDAGVDFVDGKMVGDIDVASASEIASLVTPTPGGVGPVTVVKLLENTVKAAERLNQE